MYRHNPLDEELRSAEREFITNKDHNSLHNLVKLKIRLGYWPATLLDHLVEVENPPRGRAYGTLLKKKEYLCVRLTLLPRQAQKVKKYCDGALKTTREGSPLLDFVCWTRDEGEARAVGEIVVMLHDFDLDPSGVGGGLHVGQIGVNFCLPGQARKLAQIGLRENVLLQSSKFDFKAEDPRREPPAGSYYRPRPYPKHIEDYDAYGRSGDRRRNPDENQRQLEREYGMTGDIETLDKINIIRNRTGQPLLLSRQQALEMTWREVDSDIFQFINQIWSTYNIPDALYRHLVREDNLDPDAEYEEGTGEYAVRQQIDEDLRENVTDKWRELTIKRSRAFDNYMNYLLGRKLQFEENDD